MGLAESNLAGSDLAGSGGGWSSWVELRLVELG